MQARSCSRDDRLPFAAGLKPFSLHWTVPEECHMSRDRGVLSTCERIAVQGLKTIHATMQLCTTVLPISCYLLFAALTTSCTPPFPYTPTFPTTPPANPPVLPNPPAPLSLSSNSCTSTTSGVTILSNTSCAIRSPSLIVKSSSEWLNKSTFTSPR